MGTTQFMRRCWHCQELMSLRETHIVSDSEGQFYFCQEPIRYRKWVTRQANASEAQDLELLDDLLTKYGVPQKFR